MYGIPKLQQNAQSCSENNNNENVQFALAKIHLFLQWACQTFFFSYFCELRGKYVSSDAIIRAFILRYYRFIVKNIFNTIYYNYYHCMQLWQSLQIMAGVKSYTAQIGQCEKLLLDIILHIVSTTSNIIVDLLGKIANTSCDAFYFVHKLL